ncbi:MAG: DUF4136 domain-containing protein [Bacteroidota bacterium]
MYRWIPVVSLLVLSCGQRVVSYTNSKANYKSFETYRMINPKIDNGNLDTDSSIAYDLIKHNISIEMKKRNYEPSSVSPDLILRYELTSSSRVETTTTQSFVFPIFRVNSRTIHEAVLLLEILDQNMKLVWQGSYDLNQEHKEKRVQKVIENAIGKIFTTYPYKSGESAPDPSLKAFKKNK